ncbi:hypothetical protein BH09MYX1_BH09MYX1_53040 [soil metagenome]
MFHRAMTLHADLRDLCTTFTSGILQAIRKATVGELVEIAGPSPQAPESRARAVQPPATSRGPRRRRGRLTRRTSEQLAETLARVVALVRQHSQGLRSEEIKKALDLDARELPRVFALGFAQKTLRSKGQKRSTRYFSG